VPGQPAQRPLAGPILPLVASSVGTDQLLGLARGRASLGRRAGCKNTGEGEALAPPPAAADDFVWPRREVGREQAKGDTPVAARDTGRQLGPPLRGSAASTGVLAAPKPKNHCRNNRAVAPARSHLHAISSALAVSSTGPTPGGTTVAARADRARRPRPPAAVGRSAAAQSDPWWR